MLQKVEKTLMPKVIRARRGTGFPLSDGRMSLSRLVRRNRTLILSTLVKIPVAS
jgi:hypothetical protein